MKHIALKTLAVAAVATLPLTQVAAAPFVGNESDNTYIEVGESTVDPGPHTAGLAGIGIYTMGKANKVDFQALKTFAGTPQGQFSDVYTLNMGSTSHGGLGSFNFSQVGTADVWYGEWSQDGSPNFTDRAVYYIGDKAGTTMPTSGTDVTYSVQGVSKFNPSTDNDLNGTLHVNFVAGDVSGHIQNTSLKVGINANIAGSSFSGTATADNLGTVNPVDATGASEGEFYGANAAALAGMATFSGSDSQYNTAFGGTKNP